MGLTSGTKLGRYEIVSALGRGGMGEVYRARDTRLDRTVAIKMLNSSLAASPKLKARSASRNVERKARAASRGLCGRSRWYRRDSTAGGGIAADSWSFLLWQYGQSGVSAKGTKQNEKSELRLLRSGLCAGHVYASNCYTQLQVKRRTDTLITPTRPAPTTLRDKIVDNYRYMENLNDPEVHSWLKGQDAYTRATLASVPGRDTLLARISELVGSGR